MTAVPTTSPVWPVPHCVHIVLLFHLSIEQVELGSVSCPAFFAVFPVNALGFPFKIEIHILFSVTVDAANPSWNVPCTNYCRCSIFSLGRELGVWKNNLRLIQHPVDGYNHQTNAGSCTLQSQPPPFVPRKSTCMTIAQFPTGSHPEHRSFPRWTTLSFSSAQAAWNHANSCIYQAFWSMKKTAARWRWSMSSACRKELFL